MTTMHRNERWNQTGLCAAAMGLAIFAGCNASPGPASIVVKPIVQKSSRVPPVVATPQPAVKPKLDEPAAPAVTKVASVEPAKPAVEKPIVKKENRAAPAEPKPMLVAQVAAPPAPPKKEPKWKPTIAPQPPRPTFAAPGTKFEFVPGPVGDLLKGQIGEGSPAQLAAPRGRPAPQRDGPSPAVQAAEKSTIPLPVSAYAYEGALKLVDRSKLPPSHPVRDMPALALNREPAKPSTAVMPITAPLAVGEIPPLPSVLAAIKKIEVKPLPPFDPTREPAFAATIRIAGPDVIGPAPFQKITLPSPNERSEEVRLRSEPADSEVPGLLAGRIVERPKLPVPMPIPAAPPK